MGETARHMLEVDGRSGAPSRKATQFLAAVTTGIGAVIAGTILAWTSPVLEQLKHENSTIVIDNEQGSWISSFLAIGALVLAVPIGILAEAIGRKFALLFLVIPFMLSWLLIIFSNGPVMFYIARFFAGVGTGGICVTAPMYIGEIAETSIRGALGSFFQLFLTIGILFTYVVGAFTNWRTLSIISAIIPIIFLAAFFFMPETPQWLLKKNRLRDAEKSLRWLRGSEYEISHEIETIQKEVEHASRNKASLADLVVIRANRTALICSFGLMFFQQTSGINAVIFYAQFIFDAANSSIDSSYSSIIIGVVQVVFTVASSLLIDRAGRRILLLQSCITMGICLTVLGIYFQLKDTGSNVSNIGWLPLVCLVIFIISFSMGYGPIPWMMMGELFSAECKGVASGLAVMFNWTLVFIVTKVFPMMIDGIGSAATFWVFAGFMAASTIFVFFVIPETKGKTNAEIQARLAGK